MNAHSILILFAIFISVFPTHINAHCVGVITLNTKLGDINSIPLTDNFSTSADLLIHENSFACQGPQISKMRGVIENASLFIYTDKIKANINRLKKGVHLLVKFGDKHEPKKVFERGDSAAVVWSILNKVPVGQVNSKKYLGNNFIITYPADFIARPMDLFALNQPVFKNEAFFKSPDGDVEFYVYTSVTGAQPQNYTKVAANEILADENSHKKSLKNTYRDYVLTHRATVRAKDNSYFRSFYHWRGCHTNATSTFIDCTFKVFGIKYKNKEVYQKYRHKYIMFKKSIIQASD